MLQNQSRLLPTEAWGLYKNLEAIYASGFSWLIWVIDLSPESKKCLIQTRKKGGLWQRHFNMVQLWNSSTFLEFLNSLGKRCGSSISEPRGGLWGDSKQDRNLNLNHCVCFPSSDKFSWLVLDIYEKQLSFLCKHFLPHLLNRIEKGGDSSNDFSMVWLPFTGWDAIKKFPESTSLPFLSPSTLGTYSVQEGLMERGNQSIGIIHCYCTLDLALMVLWAEVCPTRSSHQFSRFLHLTQTAVPEIQGYNALVSHAYVQLLFPGV